MSKAKKTISNFEDLGKLFGIEQKKTETQSNKEVLFFGRDEELIELQSFLDEKNAKIFGVYGVPMIGKTLLINKFIENLKGYEIIIISFTSNENPKDKFETVLNKIDWQQKNNKLIVFQNFEKVLRWEGDQNSLHAIYFKEIKQRIIELCYLPEIKIIFESRFQINNSGLPNIYTLNTLFLKGIEPDFFWERYREKGVSKDDFITICENFNGHTGLLSLAYQQVDWLYQKHLNSVCP